MYFKGREKRIVVRPDGHNIPSNQIESISNSFDEVSNSVVVGVPSKSYAHGSMAADCILVKNTLSDEEKELVERMKSSEIGIGTLYVYESKLNLLIKSLTPLVHLSYLFMGALFFITDFFNNERYIKKFLDENN